MSETKASTNQFVPMQYCQLPHFFQKSSQIWYECEISQILNIDNHLAMKIKIPYWSNKLHLKAGEAFSPSSYNLSSPVSMTTGYDHGHGHS